MLITCLEAASQELAEVLRLSIEYDLVASNRLAVDFDGQVREDVVVQYAAVGSTRDSKADTIQDSLCFPSLLAPSLRTCRCVPVFLVCCIQSRRFSKL